VSEVKELDLLFELFRLADQVLSMSNIVCLWLSFLFSILFANFKRTVGEKNILQALAFPIFLSFSIFNRNI
jgi:hypothetical protein